MMNVQVSADQRHRAGFLCSLLVIGLLLAGCGKSGTGSPSPGVSSASVSSPASGTVGELADAMFSAWSGVQTIRIVRELSPLATPVSAASGLVGRTVIERDASGNARLSATDAAGGTSEIISVGGVVFARGHWSFALPGTPVSGDWILVEQTALARDPVGGPLLRGLLAPLLPVYSGLSDTQRNRPVESLGKREIEGRGCQAYRIPATTQTGQVYDVILTLGPDNLPCAIETIGVGQRTLEVFFFNEPISIVAPKR